MKGNLRPVSTTYDVVSTNLLQEEERLKELKIEEIPDTYDGVPY